MASPFITFGRTAVRHEDVVEVSTLYGGRVQLRMRDGREWTLGPEQRFAEVVRRLNVATEAEAPSDA